MQSDADAVKFSKQLKLSMFCTFVIFIETVLW